MSIATIFAQTCEQFGLPKPVAEFKWHPTRKFRADYAWPEHRVLLELQGGVYTFGKHGRGSGIVKDMEKVSEASALGWLTIQILPKDLMSVKTTNYVKQAIANR